VKSALAAFRNRGLRPKKSFGQNFLVDSKMAACVADLAAGEGGGTVVEIGAGLGALTEPLLERTSLVVAIERDRDLCPILREAFADPLQRGTLLLLEADAKTVDLAALAERGPRPRVIAGNLPYQITGPILQAVTQVADRIDLAVFMVQAEVAERLVATPGTSAYGALTVFLTAAFAARIERRVSPGAFSPRPGVSSAIVTLVPRRPPLAAETEALRAAIRAAFAQRRKTLRNAWSKLAPPADLARRAEKAGIDLDRRGETLSVEEFARFAQSDQ
jgi:16S rRNA (adenine1518-N6/adenine1519-N6)-dimethyltransferase